MSEPSSRRSFLLGRQATADDRWAKFLSQLRRDCRGAVKLVTDYQAHLNPLQLDDVIQARRVCQAHDVILALDGLALSPADQSKPILWVQAGSAWGTVLPLGDTGLWRVDAGCPMAVAKAAGLLAADWPETIANVAQWFATALRGQLLAQTGLSDHLVCVDWMLPDGTIEVFGAFGASDSQPLSSLAAQKLVPQLFELSARQSLQVTDRTDRAVHWPLQYHLDALMDPAAVNLAHFFMGHGGSLGWLVAATFKQTQTPLPPIEISAPNPNHGKDLSLSERCELDEAIKQIMDPDGVFMSLPPQTE